MTTALTPTPPHDKWMAKALWLCAVLNVVDLISTYVALQHGAVELNPIMRWAISHGWAWATMFKLTFPNAAFIIFWESRGHKEARWATVASTIGYSLLIFSQVVQWWWLLLQ